MTRFAPDPASLPEIHVQAGGRGRRQEAEQFARPIDVAARDAHGAREHRHTLHAIRQRSRDRNAGDIREFAVLLKAEIHRTLGDPRGDSRPGRRDADSRAKFGENAPPLEDFLEMLAARPRREPQAACCEHGALQRVFRRDIGNRPTRRDRDRDARSHEIHAHLGAQLAVHTQLLDRGSCQHDDVEGFSGANSPRHVDAARRVSPHLPPGLGRVTRCERSDEIPGRHRGDDVERRRHRRIMHHFAGWADGGTCARPMTLASSNTVPSEFGPPMLVVP